MIFSCVFESISYITSLFEMFPPFAHCLRVVSWCSNPNEPSPLTGSRRGTSRPQSLTGAGSSTLDLPEWPPFNSTAQNYMLLGRVGPTLNNLLIHGGQVAKALAYNTIEVTGSRPSFRDWVLESNFFITEGLNMACVSLQKLSCQRIE